MDLARSELVLPARPLTALVKGKDGVGLGSDMIGECKDMLKTITKKAPTVPLLLSFAVPDFIRPPLGWKTNYSWQQQDLNSQPSTAPNAARAITC